MPALAPPHTEVRYARALTKDQAFVLDRDAMAALAFREVKVKEAFTVVDGRGHTFRASLRRQSAESGEAIAYEELASSPESPARITLVCAVLSRQRMLVVVQKATELGAVRVVPVFTDHSVKPGDLSHEKPWAWLGQAKKGARQCRRAVVPEVWKTAPLEEILGAEVFREADARFALDDRALGSPRLPFPDPAEAPRTRDLVLVVGPEGGFSDRERALLAAHDVTALALGARVLRAETAVFAGLSVLQHRFGDLRTGA
ncbi:MAG: RsmE family RNA methyltransferase [Polyangiaceae bacterium]